MPIKVPERSLISKERYKKQRRRFLAWSVLMFYLPCKRKHRKHKHEHTIAIRVIRVAGNYQKTIRRNTWPAFHGGVFLSSNFISETLRPISSFLSSRGSIIRNKVRTPHNSKIYRHVDTNRVDIREKEGVIFRKSASWTRENIESPTTVVNRSAANDIFTLFSVDCRVYIRNFRFVLFFTILSASLVSGFRAFVVAATQIAIDELP